MDNGRHFIVGSLYLPPFNIDCSKPAKLELAVSVATVSATGTVSFSKPIVAASGGDVCKLGQKNPPPNTVFLDKEWLAYDPASRTLAMSFDRRLTGPDSTRTDYFGEVRNSPTANGSDFRITTGATGANGTSSLIIPNFGDYTDNASSGSTTYYTWSDGRLGVPQPFVDSH